MPTFIAFVLTGGIGTYALLQARTARRLAAEASMRVTQLGAGAAGPAVVSPRCPTCTAPLQRAIKPHQGQTHYCGRCELWMVVAGA